MVDAAKSNCAFLAKLFPLETNFDVMKSKRSENWSVSQNPTQHHHHPAGMRSHCVTTSGLSRHKNYDTFKRDCVYLEKINFEKAMSECTPAAMVSTS